MAHHSHPTVVGWAAPSTLTPSPTTSDIPETAPDSKPDPFSA